MARKRKTAPNSGVGRPPTIRTPENAAKILVLLAEGQSLRAICRMDGMPSKPAILEWLAADSSFATQYARAREQQAEEMADELLEIADDGTNDWMERLGKDDQPLGWMVNGEHVQRSRLRVDARKWLMSKMKPKKYGDSTTIKGDEDAPLQHKHSGELALTPLEAHLEMLGRK